MSTVNPFRAAPSVSERPGGLRRRSVAFSSAPATPGDARGAAVAGGIAASIFTFLLCWLYLTRPGGPFGLANDFVVEAYAPLRSLYEVHVTSALTAGPAYVGSLILRTPFAAAAFAFHGDWEMVYCATAIPCVVAAPFLAVWLMSRIDIGDHTSRRIWLYMSPLCLLLPANPVLWFELILGHPEDVLGGALAIAGVVQASRGRPGWAMLLVGLAVDNESWALVCVPVALAVLPRGYLRALGVLVVTVGVMNVPLVLMRGGGPAALGGATGTTFLFPQLWWWFGSHNWFVENAHDLLVVVAFACGASWWLLRGRRLSGDTSREALVLLALVLLLRAALDPWNNVYYQMPFLMTIYALELGRPPKVSVVLTVVLTAVTVPLHLYSFDVRAAAYQTAVVPILFAFGLRVYAPDHWLALISRLRAASPSSRRLTAEP